jgi:hypothetical protein
VPPRAGICVNYLRHSKFMRSNPPMFQAPPVECPLPRGIRRVTPILLCPGDWLCGEMRGRGHYWRRRASIARVWWARRLGGAAGLGEKARMVEYEVRSAVRDVGRACVQLYSGLFYIWRIGRHVWTVLVLDSLSSSLLCLITPPRP